MHTLLLRLIGPMQSWGVQSRFSVRDTGLEPSKSGVVGLLCAASGRGRDAPIEDLAALTMGVRVDREGHLSRDYHVAGVGGYMKGGGAIERNNVVPSSRYYLADAAFLVGLQGEDMALLSGLQQALLNPVWTLYLGRKAFSPGEPIALEDGLKENTSLLQALQNYPYLGGRTPPARLRAVLEDPSGDQVRPDQPVSFAERRFATRRVRTLFFPPVVQENSLSREVS
jgi:CRISPR system Cascade subunit CasD